MAAIFNEDTRVKIPSAIQLLRLGYDYQSLSGDDFEIDFNTKIFINRFKPAIERINEREFSDEEIISLISDIHRAIGNNDLGKEFYTWLIDPNEKPVLIDFENIENNDFAVVCELPFTVVEGTEAGSFRPDANILINGMPLAFLEVKPPNNEGGIQKEFDRMINKRLKNVDYKKFFNLIQIVSFSNNMEYEDEDDAEDVRAGSFYTTPNGTNTTFSFLREDEKNYHADYPYKDIPDDFIKYVTSDLGYNPAEADESEFAEDLKYTTPCNRFITSLFDKERLLYFLQYGEMYVDGQTPEKHIMRYPQFFATRKIIERLESGGKNGIIWHTQGSGKTELAAYSNRIIRDYYTKKHINTRFFFVVDRLELLTQASMEFTNRGIRAINCSNKEAFGKELIRPIGSYGGPNWAGEMCVVNIQKFSDKMPKAKNEYDVNVQRVIFVDEAHRSYSKTGEFFTNLMSCDENAVYIALTGTPLLSKKERSNLKFGDYIHKYFYDKSIADGYTLQIKKEDIDTVVKTQLKQDIKVEDGEITDEDVFESDDYVSDLGKFIERDFNNFRIVNTDSTIGGMIVCRSNPQAKKVHEWFEKNSNLNTGLVMSDQDEPTQRRINNNNQLEFRKNTSIDILVVHFMLTTGYDVKRLKKMYLLRGPHEHALLQTISRVNRPYKSPNGKTYKYGYIVDFVDIEKEFDATLAAYIKELEEDLNENGEEEGSLSGLVIDKDDINKRYHQYLAKLNQTNPFEDLEQFSQFLTKLNKDSIYDLRRILTGIKECHTEFLVSRAFDYAKQIDIDKNKKRLKATQDRIDFLNLSTNSVDMLSVISNDEVVEIVYQFIMVRVLVLDLSQISQDNPKVKKITKIITDIQTEIKNNKNKDDINIRHLDEMLQEVFEKLDIHDISDLDAITEELEEALKEARRINAENERLAKDYGGNYAFVKTYQDAALNYPAEADVIEKALIEIYGKIEDVLDKEIVTIQGRKNFTDSVKKKVTPTLLKEGLYESIRAFYPQLLNDLYTNIQLFK